MKVNLHKDGSTNPSGLTDLNELHRSLADLDERALILTVSAFAEDTLGDLLSAFMLPLDASNQLLTGFSAPLGTFSARIKAAYALGLLTKNQFNDLEHLRKIRNEFSHTWKPITLDNQSIAGHIKALCFSALDDKYPTTPLIKLRTSLSALLIELQININLLKTRSGRATLKASGLITGIAGENGRAQIDNAQAALGVIQEKISTTKGEERLFYVGRLTVWIARLGIMLEQSSVKEYHREVQDLITDLHLKLKEMSSV